MISPEFRMTEVLPIIDQYKLYITQNHGKPLTLTHAQVTLCGRIWSLSSSALSPSGRKFVPSRLTGPIPSSSRSSRPSSSRFTRPRVSLPSTSPTETKR